MKIKMLLALSLIAICSGCATVKKENVQDEYLRQVPAAKNHILY